MEQYILKSAVVAWIERRIKEIDETGTYLSPKGVLTNLLCHLDTLEVKEQPSLPSDLDEAAKDYARCYTESDNGNGGEDWEDDIGLAFTAGARWLAEKGVSMHIDGETEWADVDAFVHRNVDEKTVIQIR